MGKSRRGRGHPTVFSDNQNRQLREALISLRPKFPSQGALGVAIGIGQQSVARLLREEGAGFSYETATAVVRLAGYAGVDTFFRARGVATPVELPAAKSA